MLKFNGGSDSRGGIIVGWDKRKIDKIISNGNGSK